MALVKTEKKHTKNELKPKPTVFFTVNSILMQNFSLAEISFHDANLENCRLCIVSVEFAGEICNLLLQRSFCNEDELKLKL